MTIRPLANAITIRLYNQEQKDLAKRTIDAAPNNFCATIEEQRRTPDQNKLMWGMLRDVSQAVVYYGQKRSDADWKNIFTAALSRADVVPGLDGRSIVQLGRSTSDMTTSEMASLIELILEYGNQHKVVFRSLPPSMAQSNAQTNAPSP